MVIVLCCFFVNFRSREDEVKFIKKVKLNRMLLKTQLVELFKDDSILHYEFSVTLLDSHERPEEGAGVGVTKEIFSVFFTEFFHSGEVR